MGSDKVESYHPNNKGGFISSSKPYTLNNIQYHTPPQQVDEVSPLVSRQDRDYPIESSIDIGEGVHSIVDYRIKEKLDFYSLWGNILCFSQLVLGSYLYFSSGLDSYFILTTIALVSHTLSCCLGLYAIATKHIFLIINYTVYAFLILGVNIAVFILSILAMKNNYPWFLFIGGLLILNLQFFGLRYIISLTLLLRDLQKKESFIHASIVTGPNPQLISQPPKQPQQVYQTFYPQQQPQQQYYYYTTSLTNNQQNPTSTTQNQNLSYKL
ncbi:hypothetical protein RB653_003690 [Dictyostelium firmibasis]|uniref:Transmembrane protein n=1 Tax=Dictyostelium firmibasis TaxID=79012 RepID=A0AAN7TZM1_9MYCE